MKRFQKSWTAAGVAVAATSSAVLASIAQRVPGFALLILVALVPLCLVLRPSRFVRTWATLALFYGLYSILAHLYVTNYDDGKLGRAVLCAVPLYKGIFLIVPVLLMRFAPGSDVQRLLLLPVAWTLMEWLERHLLLGISFTLMGVPLADYPMVAQPAAALAGPELLSLPVLGTAVMLVCAIRRSQARPLVLASVQGPILLICLAIAGAICASFGRPGDRRLDVGLIQPNIVPAVHWSPSARSGILAGSRRLLDDLIAREPNTDLIVLPESGLPGILNEDRELFDWLSRAAHDARCPVLAGSLERSDQDEVFNIAAMLTPEQQLSVYEKRRLLPFGEYIPRLGPLRRFVPGDCDGNGRQVADFSAGKRAGQFSIKAGVRGAIVVCYEDIFPDLARDAVIDGADVVIAVINTAAFKDESVGLQHLRRARLTAAACGRPLVRCANSGISSVIDPLGRVVGTVHSPDGREQFVAAATAFTVELTALRTVYGWGGDAVLPALLAGVACVVQLGARRSDRSACRNNALFTPSNEAVALPSARWARACRAS